MIFLKKFPTAVKIVLVLAILIIFVGGGIFGYSMLYKEPKIVKSTIAFGEDHLARERALINAKPPYELADSISTYKNEERAIEFQYPSNLFFFYSTIGSQSPEMRAILFQQPPEEKFFLRRVCPVDCIWVGTSLGYLGGALEYRGRARHAKRVKINGMDAVRYNVAEKELSGPYPVHIGYSLSENVTIQDPYLEERVIHISYFELFPKSLENPQSLKGRDIRQLFDPEKYKAFQTIANSLQVLPIDTDTVVRSRSDELGISFQHPAFWGSIDNLYFNSSLTRGSINHADIGA